MGAFFPKLSAKKDGPKAHFCNRDTIKYEMILRLSTKLQKKVNLNLAKEAEVETAENPHLDWHCNLFTVSRQQVIIFTNTKSLLSVFCAGKGVNDTDSLMRAFHDNLSFYLKGTPQESIYRNIIEKAPSTIWAKTNNRSVTGSMNDFIYASGIHIERGVTPAGLPELINKSPMKYLEYRNPMDAFKSLK